MNNFIELRQLLQDDFTALAKEMEKYFADETILKTIPLDFINVPKEVYNLKSKTLTRKDIYFEDEKSNDLFKQFLFHNDDFIYKFNLYVEAFGNFVIHFISPSENIGFDLEFLIPSEYFINKNGNVVKLIQKDDKIIEQVLSKEYTLIVGSTAKQTTIYDKTVGINFLTLLINTQAKYQAFSLPFVKGLEDSSDDRITFGSNKLVKLETGSDSQIGFVAPDTKINELTAVLAQKMLLICRSENIPDNFMSLSQKSDVQSGYSIKLRQEPLTAYYDERFSYIKNLFDNFIAMFNKIRIANNLSYFSGDLVYADKTQQDMLSFNESMEMDTFLINNNIIDKIDLVMKYKKLSYDDAIAYIKEREDRADKYAVSDSVSTRIAKIL